MKNLLFIIIMFSCTPSYAGMATGMIIGYSMADKHEKEKAAYDLICTQICRGAEVEVKHSPTSPVCHDEYIGTIKSTICE